MSKIANRRPATRAPRRSRRSSRTTIPIVHNRWWEFHGTHRVQNGALRGRTFTDYFVLDCPGCRVSLHYGIGVRLLGVSDHVNERRRCSNRFGPQILVFEVTCPLCRFRDHFKMSIDQGGELTESFRSNGSEGLSHRCFGERNDA